MRIYFVRHGEAISNVDHVMAGYELDTELTEKGKEQAAKTGSYLATFDPNINYIYSSPLKRAKQTAKIIKTKINCKIHYKKNLVEKGVATSNHKT